MDALSVIYESMIEFDTRIFGGFQVKASQSHQLLRVLGCAVHELSPWRVPFMPRLDIPVCVVAMKPATSPDCWHLGGGQASTCQLNLHCVCKVLVSIFF